MRPLSDRQETALEDVIRERLRQDATFGVQNHDLAYWSVILTQQVGQMAQAVCGMRWGGKTDAAVRKQAVEAAAVAVAIIECIDRGEYADDITTAKPSDARQLNIALDRGHEAIDYDKDSKGCQDCGRDNDNGTHDALEKTGHLNHHFNPHN